jgi:Domain of unknown function (DUF4112)
MEQKQQNTSTELRWLEGVATLMDSQFRIPFTNFRFGLDALIGIIPGVGDIIGLGISLFLFGIMMKKGAGPIIIVRMVGNIIIDALVGVVPVFGDIFDFSFKANRRNVNLLKNYYKEDKKHMSTVWSMVIILIVIVAIFSVIVWAIWRLISYLWN